MSWNAPVFSEMISDIGYDDSTGELLVTWKKSGKVSAYAGVPEDFALQMSKAPSVGGMFNSEVRNKYPHRYL
jgi:hypothetical protein